MFLVGRPLLPLLKVSRGPQGWGSGFRLKEVGLGLL